MKLTVSQAADELGIGHDTMRARLRAAGHAPKARDTFSLIQIIEAFIGSLQREKIRAARLDNEEREEQRAIRRGQFVDKDSAKHALRAVLAPLRSRLMSLPAAIAFEANPDNPEMARKAIHTAIERALRDASGEREFK